MTIGHGITIAGKTTRAAMGTPTPAGTGTVRLTVTLPFDSFGCIKSEAIRQNVSIARLVRTYVEIGLADDRRLIDGPEASR